MAIALHYLILALRHDTAMESEMAREYCAGAARWQKTACESTVAALAAKATEEN
jgi:hypothetical protein